MRPYKALLGSVAVAVAVAIVVPEAPRGSQTLPVLGVNCVTKAVFDGDAVVQSRCLDLRYCCTETLPEAPRGVPEAPRGSQRLPEALRVENSAFWNHFRPYRPRAVHFLFFFSDLSKSMIFLFFGAATSRTPFIGGFIGLACRPFIGGSLGGSLDFSFF